MEEDEVVSTARLMTGGFGVDCVLDVAVSANLIPPGLRCLRIGGGFIEIDNSFPDARFCYDASDIIWRRVTFTGIHNYDALHLQKPVNFLRAACGEFPFEEIVSQQFSLIDIDAALQAAAAKKSIRVAVLPG
jgi:threonine dehydrogenase-like Zn-dependent dehydrogenase